jgi:hypothetical protein
VDVDPTVDVHVAVDISVDVDISVAHTCAGGDVDIDLRRNLYNMNKMM